MNLIEQINLIFGGFKDKACRAWDVVYFYVDDGTDTGIYVAGKFVTFDKEFWYKIVGSFTELFTTTEAQRLFRNLYNYGCDKGTDGR